jgi:hypothetical protein
MALKKKSLSNTSFFRCGVLSHNEIHYFSINEIDLVPSEMGWYCWVYVPTASSDLSVNIATPPEVKVKVDGIFGKTYSGRVSIDSRKPFQTKPELTNELASVSLAFAGPLYIGISSNLRVRLHRHKQQLRDFLNFLDFLPQEEHSPFKKNLDAKNELDTDTESEYFGKRIAHFLYSHQISINCLFIKCITTKNKEHLKNIEGILNATYTPPYGRR